MDRKLDRKGDRLVRPDMSTKEDREQKNRQDKCTEETNGTCKQESYKDM